MSTVEDDVRMMSSSSDSEDEVEKPVTSEGNAAKIASLDDMIAELYKAFDGEVVDVDHVRSVMGAYKSNSKDWKKYAFFDTHRYTRNLVDTGNGKFNLMALCWSEGQGSSIHSHSDAHCFVKVLDGQLKETLYAWPPSDVTEEQPLIQTDSNIYGRNGVAYINDSLGLHRMENPSHSDRAVSLHLYCPPFGQCDTFDEKTGHKRQVKMTFTSVKGTRTPIGQ
jgi:cysteine dioxygenase